MPYIVPEGIPKGGQLTGVTAFDATGKALPVQKNVQTNAG